MTNQLFSWCSVYVSLGNRKCRNLQVVGDAQCLFFEDLSVSHVQGRYWWAILGNSVVNLKAARMRWYHVGTLVLKKVYFKKCTSNLGCLEGDCT